MTDSVPQHHCLRCGGAMEDGCLLDRGNSNARYQGKWVEGPVETGWFLRLKVKDRAVLPVVTSRCTRCGWLDSYANPAADA